MSSTSFDEGTVRKPPRLVTGLSGVGRDTGTEESDRQLGQECRGPFRSSWGRGLYFEQGGKPLENLGQRTFVLTSHVSWSPLAALLNIDHDCSKQKLL